MQYIAIDTWLNEFRKNCLRLASDKINFSESYCRLGFG